LRAATWCAGVLLATALGPQPGRAENRPVDDWTRADHSRVVKVFDFEEPDNLGDVPKFWQPFPGDSFPRFTTGGFDRTVGRTAPPSFYLDTHGRNVAFRYRGIETRVRPNADYLVVAWIKPNHLRTSRATITAYYLDHEGLPLAGTQRQGRLVGGDAGDDEWQAVEVFVPGGPHEADALGLTLWVEQAAIWDPTPRPERHIEATDVTAGAWFDDILIYRLPRASLAALVPGNIFVTPQVPVLEVTVLDPDSTGLSAALEIVNAEGVSVGHYAVPVQAAAQRVELPGLEPGHYRARLTVSSDAMTLVQCDATFAVLADLRGESTATARAFGVVLEGAARAGADAELGLIAAAGLGAVKVPLWTGSTLAPGFAEDTATLDGLLNGLLRLRVDVTGVLGGLPPALSRMDEAYKRTLMDMLSDPAESWRGFLAAAVAPYVSVFASWQIGADGDGDFASDRRLEGALDAVRRELRTLMTTPYVTAPARLDVDPEGRQLAAERVTLAIPTGVHPDYIAAHLKAFEGLGRGTVEAYVAPPPLRYERVARLAYWATQIIEARHAGVDTVYAPQMWRWRQTNHGRTVEPTEDFVVFRTVAMILGDSRPDGELPVDGGMRARLFAHGARGVLAVWDEQAPPEGRPWEIQLGEEARAVDLWGRTVPIERTEGGLQRITLTAAPLFIEGVERWVLAFQREMRITPETVAFAFGPQEHTLRIANPSHGVLSGRVTLEVPEGWRAQPRVLEFSIPAGGESTFPVELTYNHNEPAGIKIIEADAGISGAGGYRMRIPLRFELGLADVDVWGFATAEGNRVVVRHGVRNRSSGTLSFRAYAAAPGRDRQEKIIIGLEPGQTIEREYRFENADGLVGRSIRVSLREVSGPRMHNLQLAVP
jgi:hypothetical protein